MKIDKLIVALVPIIFVYLCVIIFFPWDKTFTALQDESLELESLKIEKNNIPSKTLVLKWGMIDYRGVNIRSYQKIANYIKKTINIDLRIKTLRSYDELEADVTVQSLDMVNISSLSLVRVNESLNYQLTPVVSELYHGSEFYIGYIIALRNSNINNFDDLKNKVFAFANIKSASGYIYPYAALVERKIKPKEHFSKIVFSGNHSKVLQDVLSGKVDAGATYDASFLTIANPEKKLKILAKTAKIPSGIIAVSKSVDSKYIKMIQKVFLQLSLNNDPWVIEFRRDTDITGWNQFNSDNLNFVKSAYYKMKKKNEI